MLRPGDVFAGNDNLTSLLCRILHFRDTCNHVSPKALPDRLHAAGLHDIDVRHDTQRWHAIISELLGSRSTFCQESSRTTLQNVDLDSDLEKADANAVSDTHRISRLAELEAGG